MEGKDSHTLFFGARGRDLQARILQSKRRLLHLAAAEEARVQMSDADPLVAAYAALRYKFNMQCVEDIDNGN